MNHLDLFSGIGGFALAAQMAGGIETVGFCEIDPWAQRVLKKNFPGVPIHDDIKTLNTKKYGTIDIITGGYPCQPFSSIGKKLGKEDPRHLWPFMFSIIKQKRPSWIIAENVAGHVSMGLDEVLHDLEGQGYNAKPIIIPACAVGSPQKRDRVWVVANAKSWGDKRIVEKSRCEKGKDEGSGGQQNRESLRDNPGSPKIRGQNIWESEPRMGRVVNGLPQGLDRIRGLGNAIVPQVAAEILRAMMSV